MTQKLSIKSTLKLNNGNEIPVLGLGTYQMHDSAEAAPAVTAALKMGYRHIDTAEMYENEEAIGRAIKESGIPRKDIFITTKLYDIDSKTAEAALEVCLKKLDTGYVDLLLMHWPLHDRLAIWGALEGLQKSGQAKNIGVSNFTVDHLKELLDSCRVIPQVNQVERSPFLTQMELIKFCNAHNIVVEAYSPLTRGHQLDHPTITKIAQSHSKSSAQVLIRWGLQEGTVVLPKSSKPARIAGNADVFDFELSQAEMTELSNLNANQRYCWDPTV